MTVSSSTDGHISRESKNKRGTERKGKKPNTQMQNLIKLATAQMKSSAIKPKQHATYMQTKFNICLQRIFLTFLTSWTPGKTKTSF
jgi:hypothetical protein